MRSDVCRLAHSMIAAIAVDGPRGDHVRIAFDSAKLPLVRRQRLQAGTRSGQRRDHARVARTVTAGVDLVPVPTGWCLRGWSGGAVLAVPPRIQSSGPDQQRSSATRTSFGVPICAVQRDGQHGTLSPGQPEMATIPVVPGILPAVLVGPRGRLVAIPPVDDLVFAVAVSSRDGRCLLEHNTVGIPDHPVGDRGDGHRDAVGDGVGRLVENPGEVSVVDPERQTCPRSAGLRRSQVGSTGATSNARLVRSPMIMISPDECTPER